MPSIHSNIGVFIWLAALDSSAGKPLGYKQRDIFIVKKGAYDV